MNESTKSVDMVLPGVIVLLAQIDTPGVKTLNVIKKLRKAARGIVT